MTPYAAPFANQEEPVKVTLPLLAIEHLKLAVFCVKLYEQTDRKLPEMKILDRYNLIAVEDQKRIEDDYLSSKDPGLKL